jgi:hypothetical protein
MLELPMTAPRRHQQPAVIGKHPQDKSDLYDRHGTSQGLIAGKLTLQG